MAKGMSLHLGLNSVDPNHYNGWSGPLRACEFDSQDMQDVAEQNGYETRMLLTDQATRDSVKNSIIRASEILKPGDIFFVSYSGHGGQIPDYNGDEEDGLDETWCLYDGQMIDDELDELWAKFKSDVRILVLSDSCHSGTVTRAAITMATMNPVTDASQQPPVYRLMPHSVALRTYRAHKSMYDEIAGGLPQTKSQISATVRLISGCQDNQYSMDGAHNGLFTGTLLGVWNEGNFQGNYERFHKKIIEKMPATQSPNLFVYGVDNPEFAEQKPFQINPVPSAPTNLTIK